MTLTQADFEFIRQMLVKRSGIALVPGKEYLVEARLGAVAQRFCLADVHAVVERLRGDPSGLIAEAVIECMTTNETSFFRDVHPFELLRDVVVPDVLKTAGARKVTIWCAACSTGQEPYTIAMILRDKFGPSAESRFSIVASDLSSEVLAKARVGQYTQFELGRGLSAEQISRYFEPRGSCHQVKDELRRMVEFRALNLIEDWCEFPPLDIVFLRNVLIYFERSTKQRILNRVRRSLSPGGYLFLGGAETTMGVHDGFDRRQYHRAVVYQRRTTAFTSAKARQTV